MGHDMRPLIGAWDTQIAMHDDRVAKNPPGPTTLAPLAIPRSSSFMMFPQPMNVRHTETWCAAKFSRRLLAEETRCEKAERRAREQQTDKWLAHGTEFAQELASSPAHLALLCNPPKHAWRMSVLGLVHNGGFLGQKKQTTAVVGVFGGRREPPSPPLTLPQDPDRQNWARSRAPRRLGGCTARRPRDLTLSPRPSHLWRGAVVGRQDPVGSARTTASSAPLGHHDPGHGLAIFDEVACGFGPATWRALAVLYSCVHMQSMRRLAALLVCA
ncbi:hypothetical protein F4802DRAFT_348447 [Xylaria palmicola]|nr:hypothetical protein F4802DRAFT_348447 [Xylaria palmicola]